MNPLRFVVPTEFSDSALFERFGAIIKEKGAGKIVGHVQELGGWDALKELPVPGGNPLGLAVKALQSTQLHQIKQTLGTIQTLATVGAVASVASLGVSIAGFALVMSRLNRMEGKLDALLAGHEATQALIKKLSIKADAMVIAELQGALDQLALAPMASEQQRVQMVNIAVAKLVDLRNYYSILLASEEFCAIESDKLVALVDAEERLVAACLGELMGSFMQEETSAMMNERRGQQRKLFEQIAWDDEIRLDDLVRRADLRSRGHLVTPPAQRVERVKAVAAIRAESSARLDSLCELRAALHERGVRPTEYLQEVERKSAESTDPLLVLDAREGVGQ